MDAPIILNVDAGVEVCDVGIGRALGLDELARSERNIPCQEILFGGLIRTEVGKGKAAIESGGGVAGFASSPESASKLENVIAVNHGSIVLQLVAVLQIVAKALATAAAFECAENVDGR